VSRTVKRRHNPALGLLSFFPRTRTTLHKVVTMRQQHAVVRNALLHNKMWPERACDKTVQTPIDFEKGEIR
jgi:hypothetical protein